MATDATTVGDNAFGLSMSKCCAFVTNWTGWSVSKCCAFITHVIHYAVAVFEFSQDEYFVSEDALLLVAGIDLTGATLTFDVTVTVSVFPEAGGTATGEATS